jgi:tetratricopeptide (TPR) repeat protein
MRDELPLIFREVADLTPVDRERYFEKHHVTADVRAEIDSLLKFDSPDTPLANLLASEAEAVLEGREPVREGVRCGPYRLTRLLGRGGTGEVFLAERPDEPSAQQVAIKLLRQNTLRRSFLQRFVQEREILSALEHPGIARLLDAGQTPGGRPYLVLDHIDGVPIDVYSDRLDLRAKLGLFRKVCDAVSYAHRNLVIHRDLKPSNILVTAQAEPKLLDFGLAKILDATTDQTRTQDRLMTPDYASPEQVRGAAQSTATDVYSLGAVLYRILTGQSPHVLPASSAEAIQAAICDTDPVPATCLNPTLPEDLDYIVLKALRKDPADRYSSAEALSDDIGAFLDWRPIRAKSGDAWYRTRKFMRRYRVIVTAAAVTIAALSAGLYIANRQRIVAQQRFQQLHLLSDKVFDLDTRIKQLPGATDARQELVAMSLEYLERLGASSKGDLDLAQEIAAGFMRVAEIQGVPTALNLGDATKAEQNLAKADGLIDQVLASRGNNAAALAISAEVAQDRMILADSQARNVEAKAHSEKAVERLASLMNSPSLTAPQRRLAATYYANIALSKNNLHQYEEGRQYAKKSMEADGGEPRIRAAALSLIGSAFRSEGRLQESLQALQEARRIAEGPIFPNPVQRSFDLYGILLREARTLGQDGGVSLGRSREAIPLYQEAVDLMEAQAAKDPRDQTARDRLATCARELAELLTEHDPQLSLAVFDLSIHRLREVKNNLRARRREAQALAESSYPLRHLHRLPEARQRIDDAFALLRETKDYPSEHLNPDSEVVSALRAQADYESESGDRHHAVDIYDRLLAVMMPAHLDSLTDLLDANKLSTMYFYAAAACRRAGQSERANELDERRLSLWRQWDAKLPHNEFVLRQLTLRTTL